MTFRQDDELRSEQSGGFDADYTAASIAELEEQYERGEIERHTYLVKKQALVRLFLKATTQPKRRRPSWDEG